MQPEFGRGGACRLGGPTGFVAEMGQQFCSCAAENARREGRVQREPISCAVDSSGAVIIAQHSAEPFATLDGARYLRDFRSRVDQVVAQTLAVALGVIMRQVLFDGISQLALAEVDEKKGHPLIIDNCVRSR